MHSATGTDINNDEDNKCVSRKATARISRDALEVDAVLKPPIRELRTVRDGNTNNTTLPPQFMDPFSFR